MAKLKVFKKIKPVTFITTITVASVIILVAAVYVFLPKADSPLKSNGAEKTLDAAAIPASNYQQCETSPGGRVPCTVRCNASTLIARSFSHDPTNYNFAPTNSDLACIGQSSCDSPSGDGTANTAGIIVFCRN